jgi:hypothetical protein
MVHDDPMHCRDRLTRSLMATRPSVVEVDTGDRAWCDTPQLARGRISAELWRSVTYYAAGVTREGAL